jgi:hypothetical protein
MIKLLSYSHNLNMSPFVIKLLSLITIVQKKIHYYINGILLISEILNLFLRFTDALKIYTFLVLLAIIYFRLCSDTFQKDHVTQSNKSVSY